MLVEDLRAALDAAARTPLGQKALHGHDEDFDLEVAGAGTFHIAFRGGGVEIATGPSPRREALHCNIVQVDEPTLRDVLAGRTSPVEAMEAGTLFLRTRLYGGALLTILLRAAYDQARDNTLRGSL